MTLPIFPILKVGSAPGADVVLHAGIVLLALCGSFVADPPCYPAPFSWEVNPAGTRIMLNVDRGDGPLYVRTFSWPSEVGRAYEDGILERWARDAWAIPRVRSDIRRVFPAGTFHLFIRSSLRAWGRGVSSRS